VNRGAPCARPIAIRRRAAIQGGVGNRARSRDVGAAGAPAGAVVHHRRQLHSALGASPPPHLEGAATATTAPNQPAGVADIATAPRRRRLNQRRAADGPAGAGVAEIDRRTADSALPSCAVVGI
jgi:hypothetical protein